MTDPLALPPCEPGGSDPSAVADSIGEWVTSPALAELASCFGGTPPAAPVPAVLDWAAEFSAVWDFRAGVKERFDTDRINYDPDLDTRIRALIHTLGLGGRPPAHTAYDHIVILGGGIRVALGRTEYTAGLLASGLRARTVAGLGSLRWRDDREAREAARLGLDPVDTEADMMTVALRRFLNLPPAPVVLEGDGWWHRIWPAPASPPPAGPASPFPAVPASSSLAGSALPSLAVPASSSLAGSALPSLAVPASSSLAGSASSSLAVPASSSHAGTLERVHVLAAASTRPPLRANTADTLIGWAEHVHTPTPSERVLLVTNAPYVRHQHCDAVRLLGRRYSCGIETIGFDDLTMQAWGRPLSTTELLQEVRSSLLAMRNLHAALVPSAT